MITVSEEAKQRGVLIADIGGGTQTVLSTSMASLSGHLQLILVDTSCQTT